MRYFDPTIKQAVLEAHRRKFPVPLAAHLANTTTATAQAIIDDYEEDERLFREECQRIDGAGPAQHDDPIEAMLEEYRVTGASSPDLAAKYKMGVKKVRILVDEYDRNRR